MGSDNALRLTSRQIQGRAGGGQGGPYTVNRPKPSLLSLCFPDLAPADLSFILHYNPAPLQGRVLHSTPSPLAGYLVLPHPYTFLLPSPPPKPQLHYQNPHLSTSPNPPFSSSCISEATNSPDSLRCPRLSPCHATPFTKQCHTEISGGHAIYPKRP